MILMSLYHRKEVPFREVYLHGLVRDADGRKMSKSLGNIINPVDMIQKFGTDAVRLSLLIGNTAGNDLNLGEEKIAGFRNFTNKLWNISRFVLMTVKDVKLIEKTPKPKTLADRWILGRLQVLKQGITKNLNEYNFSQAGEDLRNFTWSDFADWYLEIAKIEKNKDEILLFIIQELLKMWHPFMPFVTEEIWKNFNAKNLLMVQLWPSVTGKNSYTDKNTFNEFKILQSIIVAIRNLKAEHKLSSRKDVPLIFFVKKSSSSVKLLTDSRSIIERMSHISSFQVISDFRNKPKASFFTVVEGIEIHIPSSGIINTDVTQKEISLKESYIKALTGKLSNKEFIEKAPKHIVDAEKMKLSKVQDELEKLKQNI